MRFLDFVDLCSPPGASVRERVVQRGIHQWRVREVDARAVPGSRGATCLICESFEVIRRLWIFPQDWELMGDDALWQLCEQPPVQQRPPTAPLMR